MQLNPYKISVFYRYSLYLMSACLNVLPHQHNQARDRFHLSTLRILLFYVNRLMIFVQFHNKSRAIMVLLLLWLFCRDWIMEPVLLLYKPWLLKIHALSII